MSRMQPSHYKHPHTPPPHHPGPTHVLDEPHAAVKVGVYAEHKRAVGDGLHQLRQRDLHSGAQGGQAGGPSVMQPCCRPGGSAAVPTSACMHHAGGTSLIASSWPSNSCRAGAGRGDTTCASARAACAMRAVRAGLSAGQAVCGGPPCRPAGTQWMGCQRRRSRPRGQRRCRPWRRSPQPAAWVGSRMGGWGVAGRPRRQQRCRRWRRSPQRIAAATASHPPAAAPARACPHGQRTRRSSLPTAAGAAATATSNCHLPLPPVPHKRALRPD